MLQILDTKCTIHFFKIMHLGENCSFISVVFSWYSETVKSTSFLAKFCLCTYTAGTKTFTFRECEISEYSEQLRPGVFEEKSNVLCEHNQAQSKERERKNKEYFSGK
ncbi:hypothetical protein CDAR_551131 [Caerostris darwini]|uniref:Uncharacterized protein n=1 Tax=Caerostris darwini TaxID=1538125 RepID=A0AAV4VPB4_9ARAC|nr:hypothetical protein CDAR_551131 [Caerostris darwini]